jgi:biopolymer transport protein ExbD
VSINQATRQITLNNEPVGTVDEAEPLTNQLLEIFKQREANDVRSEVTNQIEKTIFIKSPTSVKYGDVVKVIDAVKASGAQPIGLQIDDLNS